MRNAAVPQGRSHTPTRLAAATTPAAHGAVATLARRPPLPFPPLPRGDCAIAISQIFTKPLGDRPTVFIEIIERVGCMREARTGPGGPGEGKGREGGGNCPMSAMGLV